MPRATKSCLRSFTLALVGVALCSVTSAQCPTEDAFEPNDDCASAMPGTVGVTSGLVVSDVSSDTWAFTVPAGQAIRVAMATDPLQADADLTLFGALSCAAPDILDAASSLAAIERVDYINTTAAPRDVFLAVWLFSGTCADYSLEINLVPDQCVPGIDDSFEPNDTCSTAIAPSSSPLTGLYLDGSHPDYFSFVIPPETMFTARSSHALSFDSLTLRLIDSGDCVTTIVNAAFGTGSMSELNWNNNSPNPVPVVLEVGKGLGGLFTCQDDYTLEWMMGPGLCAAFPPDSIEPNNDCASALPLAPGSYLDLTVRKPLSDVDWFEIFVPANSQLIADALFAQSAGDIDLELYLGCGGVLVDEGVTITDNEAVSYINTTGSPVTLVLHAFIWPGDFNECTTYDVDVDIQSIGSNLAAFCFGDGSGAQCPCNNNSSAGHLGGCAHADGDGAILLPFGQPSATNDTLSFDLISASFSTFGLLVSGDNQLPQVGCVACGIPAFDGLRCAGGNFRRHGTRGIFSTGSTMNSWGAASGSPLIAANGFIAGQSRSFFVFYRTSLNSICMSGQNSSNALEVTFAP